MKINSKIDDYDTISDSKQAIQTPKSAPINFVRGRLQKNLSLMEPRDAPKLWRQSSSSLSRERSPSHKIPNSSRFTISKEQEMKSRQFLVLDLRGQIGSKNSIRFAQSKRPDHFLKSQKADTPSPATYDCHRFLQGTHSSMLVREYQQKNGSASLTPKQLKGISIPSFSSHHKSYIQHSKHRFYQPQNTQDNPGPGKYNHSFVNKKKKESYSIRISLKKFNQTTAVGPGPGAYTPFKSQRLNSINMKGTIPLSKRTYLNKFEKFPSPQKYHIARFLEEYT